MKRLVCVDGLEKGSSYQLSDKDTGFGTMFDFKDVKQDLQEDFCLVHYFIHRDITKESPQHFMSIHKDSFEAWASLKDYLRELKLNMDLLK